LSRCVPEYETLPGWNTDISGAKDVESLPKEFGDFVGFIETRANVNIKVISVGPDREQTIVV
jgi:adenylosuccinate synthase